MEIDANTPEKQQQQDDVVAIELPAPSGWTKKFTPKPRRNEIVFISPTGEEIKSKKQLEQYLKSHAGGHSASDFDWGTGDTPRRSARLTEKSKATESAGSKTPKKKQKKSSSKKGGKQKNDADEGGKTADENEGNAEETKESEEVTMADAEDAGELGDGDFATGEALLDEDKTKDAVERRDDDKKDEKLKIEEDPLETNKGKCENQEAGDWPSDGMDENAESKALPSTGTEDSNKETEGTYSEPEAPLDMSLPNEAPSVQESVAVESSYEVAGAKIEEPTGSRVELLDQSEKEASVEKVESTKAVAASSDNSYRDETEKPGEKDSLTEEGGVGNQGTSS